MERDEAKRMLKKIGYFLISEVEDNISGEIKYLVMKEGDFDKDELMSYDEIIDKYTAISRERHLTKMEF